MNEPTGPICDPPLLGTRHSIHGKFHAHHAAFPWSVRRRFAPKDESSPQFVDRKVRALLNKLTMEKFDSISGQILEWANRSVKEVDVHTLIQVIRLVFAKAIDEEIYSEMYARLCRFLSTCISQDVRDEGLHTSDGKQITGGRLFHKYLLNRCQNDFERGWSAREVATPAVATKAGDDKDAAPRDVICTEELLYSDEYRAFQKVRRRGLGLVKFLGELFKLRLLTERIMHECTKKLLANVGNPKEEEIESLCQLLSTVGRALDTPKARKHMNIYFGRMDELANSGQINFRLQYMLLVSKHSSGISPIDLLQDIIELRARKWLPRARVRAPIATVEIPQKAARRREGAVRGMAPKRTGSQNSMLGGRRAAVIGKSDLGDEDAILACMSLEQARKKIKEDLKELFMLRQLSEAEGYFSSLPLQFRWHLVEELVHRAVEARANDVKLISDVFDLVAAKSLVDEEQFARGFAADMEYLEDTSTDSPNAYGNVASLLKGSRLSLAAVERLADMIIVEGDMSVKPKDELLLKYATLM